MFYGLDFASKGIISVDPPEANGAFPILVPQVDTDGNELAGVKMPEISVPLATYTGWNLFNAESGPTSLLSSMQGSYIPLPRTRADRERSKDPRTSIEERYQSRERYLALVVGGRAGTGAAALPARRRRRQRSSSGRTSHWSLSVRERRGERDAEVECLRGSEREEKREQAFSPVALCPLPSNVLIPNP